MLIAKLCAPGVSVACEKHRLVLQRWMRQSHNLEAMAMHGSHRTQSAAILYCSNGECCHIETHHHFMGHSVRTMEFGTACRRTAHTISFNQKSIQHLWASFSIFLRFLVPPLLCLCSWNGGISSSEIVTCVMLSMRTMKAYRMSITDNKM